MAPTDLIALTRTLKMVKTVLVALFLFSTLVWAEDHSLQSRVEKSRLTEKQHFEVRYTSHLDPIVINAMHAWTLHIQHRSGEPVTDAIVRIEGGMPEHDHGLPTRPRITQNLGNGEYLLEGMKFHMGGQWQVTLSIQQDKILDRVTFNLSL